MPASAAVKFLSAHPSGRALRPGRPAGFGDDAVVPTQGRSPESVSPASRVIKLLTSRLISVNYASSSSSIAAHTDHRKISRASDVSMYYNIHNIRFIIISVFSTPSHRKRAKSTQAVRLKPTPSAASSAVCAGQAGRGTAGAVDHAVAGIPSLLQPGEAYADEAGGAA